MDIIMKLPRHMSLTIEHNPHRTMYESMDRFLQVYTPDFADDVDRQKCIESNEIWLMTWRPDTPVGLCSVAASTFDGLMAMVEEDAESPNGCSTL